MPTPDPRRLAAALFLLLAPAAAAARQGESINGFPSWQERVIHEWVNRARCDPQVEIAACGANCAEGGCYAPKPPLPWSLALNRAARFHSDEMKLQGFFSHTSHCTLPSNISSLYPGSCQGQASCACVGGTSQCNPGCTTFAQRVTLFGASPSGEIIVNGPSDPSSQFYLWLYEPSATTGCSSTPQNGHRWLILNSNGGSFGAGTNAGYATGDFGGGGTPHKIPSGSHHPRQASSVAVWANWYDASGPSRAEVDVDGTLYPLTLQRGTPQNGAWSATIPGVGSGCHRYFFVFVDAAGTTFTYPATGSLGIGPAGSCADWDATRPVHALSFCAGDGSSGLCPCANAGGAGRGCASSSNGAGALLAATGTVAPDTVVLAASGEPSNALSIFMQGNVAIPPTAFGDGLRCAGGTIKRLATKPASGGGVAYPAAGEPSITARSASLGDPIAPGTTRIYQTYYRDPALLFCPFPLGDGWNVTQALRIAW